MKKIQPFTINTKLSIPVESRCADCADIYLSAPAPDSCKQKGSNSHLTKDCNEPQPQSQSQQVDHAASPVEDFQEDPSLDSPSSSSRSIKKIAICTSGEIQEEDFDAEQRKSKSSIKNENNNINSKKCTTPIPKSVQLECEDISSQLKNEAQSRLKPRDLKWTCGVPPCPAQHSDGTAQTQQWALKDFENSLIQLTASLDFREEDPQEKHQINDFSSEKLWESAGGEELNRPWLRLRTLLKSYQKDLMLALDVSNFYQQADNLIRTINNKRRSVSLPNNQAGCVDTDVGEIASQIRILGESAVHLSDLHPTLATRVTRKQAEVKHSWARLQDALRNRRPEDLQILPQCSNEKPCNLAASPSAVEPEALGIMGKDIKEEQNRLKGVEDTLDSLDKGRLMMTDRDPENNSRVEAATTANAEVEEWKQQVTDPSIAPSEDRGKLPEQVEGSTSSADKTRSWLRANIGTALDQEKLAEDPNCPKIEELLEQVEVLWELVRRREGRPGREEVEEEEEEEEEEAAMGDEEATLPRGEEERGLEVKECKRGSARAKVPPENVGECDSGMLTKFLEHLEQKGSHGMWQVVHGPGERPGRLGVTARDALEVRVDLSETGSAWKRPAAQDLATEQLVNLLSTLTLRINEHLSRCAELSMDILDLESDMSVVGDPDLTGLEGLQEQQDDLEVDFHIMAGEVEDMEKLVANLKALPPERSLLLGEEVQATLQAWEEVGRSLAENRERLSKFRHLQEFFEKYLTMIAWAEDTRSCMFSSGSEQQGGDEEGSVTAELDLRIQQKMEEFTQLTSAGQTLMDDGHHLAEIIRERTDELQSMLGWIRDNWRSQKDQMNQRKRAPGVVEGPGNDHLPPKNKATSPGLFQSQRVVEKPAPQAQPISDREPINQSSGSEHQHTGSVSSSLSITSAPRVATVMPVNPGSASVTSVSSVVVDDPGNAAPRPLGNSICLILSLDEEERGISQVQKPTELLAQEPPEGTHRVSTFLHVNDSSKALEKICEDVSASGTNEEEHLPLSPAPSSYSSSSSSSSSSNSSSSSSSTSLSPSSPSVPAVSSVFIPTLSKMATIPSCLGGKTTKPGRHQRRRSTLGIAGLDDSARASAAARPSGTPYCTNTWPLGCRKQRRLPSNTELQVYVKPNPLLMNSIQTGRFVADAVSSDHLHSQLMPAESTSGQIKSQCCYLSMGSTLSFNLSKDLGQFPSVPVLDACDPPEKVSKVPTEISAVDFDPNVQSSHHPQARPTALPTTYQEPPPVPPMSKQKQFILSPVEEAKHETPWDQEPKEDHLSDTVPHPSQPSAFNSVSAINSSAAVSSNRDCSPRSMDSATVQSEIALTIALSQGEEEDAVLEMATKASKGEDSASKANVCPPNKLPCCAATSRAVKATGPIHKCLSVHTKIKDLNGHIYHRPKEVNSSKSNSMISTVECTSSLSGESVRKNVRPSTRKTSRVIVCADVSCSVCSDTPANVTTGSSKGSNSGACGSRLDSIQPGRWEFEEEEEELKGIWGGKASHGDRQEVKAGGNPPPGSKTKARHWLRLEKPGEPLIQCPPLQSAVQMGHEGCSMFACEDFTPRVPTQHQAERKQSSGPCPSDRRRAFPPNQVESALSLKSKSEPPGRSVHEFSVNTKKEPVAFTLTLKGGPSGYTAVHPTDGPLCVKHPGRTEEGTDMALPQVMQSAFRLTSTN